MKYFQRTIQTALIVFLSILGSSVALGQSSKGILAGTAKDATGAAIANATVTIKGEQTGETRTVKTTSDGGFRVEGLSPESYTISVAQPGFNNYSAQHVNVAASVVTNYTVTLAIGSRSDTITIEADQTTLNTTDGQLAGTVTSQDLKTLPIFSLNPLELGSTIPGVQIVTGDNQFSNGVNLQVFGARPRSNNFLLDSQEINDIGIGGQAFQPQIPDMYENLTVITNSASAEYARAGGGIFNLITRSGTNTFHGTAYDRYTGSGLNAVPYSLRGTGTRNARVDSHTIGFTGGGYIFKDKLFGFGGAQFGRVYGKEQIAPFYVPDQTGIATLNSLVNAPANPTVTTQVALLKTYLQNLAYLTTYTKVTSQPTTTINIGTVAGCATNPCLVQESQFQAPAVAQSNPDTQWGYRVDFKPGQKDTFYVRYLHDRSSFSPDFFANAAGGQLGLNTFQGGPSELGAGSWTHVFTPNVLNEIRASETRINFQFAPLPSTAANPTFAMPTYNIGGFPSLGPNQNFPQGRVEDLYQVQDTFSWTHGRHSLRFGFDIGRQLEKDLVSQNAKGTANFTKGGTGITALGNFLLNQLGPSGTVTKTLGPTRVDPHVWRSGFFAQDDFKLSSTLSLNFGVRYDYTGNPENSLQYPGIDPNNPYQAATTFVAVNNDKNNISPRLGFAYTPNFGGYFGSGKTVVRGGFGIFYDSYFSNFVINAAQSSPNAIAGTVTQTTTSGPINPTTTLASFTPTVSPTASVTSVVNNLVNPQTYQYNLGIEQQVTGGLLMAIRYVGNRGEKLFANQQYNYFNGVTGTRLNTTRGAINARGNFADSNFNGVGVEATERWRRGLSVRANYQFGKDLDDGSEIFATGDSPTSYSANLTPGGRRQDYGPSAFDHRHYVSIAYTWTPPGFRSDNKLTNTLLGALTRNWTISGVEQFQSGAYGSFNNSGIDTNGDGSAANDRPILGNPSAPLETAGIDGALIGGTPGVYYDVAELNTIGNGLVTTAAKVHFLIPYDPTRKFLPLEIGRNSYQNPGSMVNDIALQKGFGTGLLHFERGQVVLRAEVSNFINHNDRGAYLDTDTLDFGLPTSFNTPQLARGGSGRNIVLWGRFVF